MALSFPLFNIFGMIKTQLIMRLNNLLAALLLTMGVSSVGAHQIKKQYYVDKAGTLISQMTEEEANSVTHLTLTVKII